MNYSKTTYAPPQKRADDTPTRAPNCMRRWEDLWFKVNDHIPCLFDGVDRDKPMGLACPCPKCTPRC